MRKNPLIILLLIIPFLITACGTAAPEADVDPPAVEADAEEPAANEDASTTDEESEMDDDSADEAAIDAAALFGSNCSGCHAPDRSGNIGPALLPERLTKDPSVYIQTITDGSGGMPSFGGRLSAAEIEALVEFITTAPQ